MTDTIVTPPRRVPLGRLPYHAVIRFLRPAKIGIPAASIEGTEIYLRPPRGRDWRRWSKLRAESRDFLAPWEPVWPQDALSRLSFLRRVRRQQADWRQDVGYHMLIFRQGTHQLLGGISLTNIRRGVAQMGTLGYWIGQPYARMGFMTEAVRIVLAFAFQQVGLHRVDAACLPGNDASQGLLRKIGFREEGLARGYLRIAGEWRDHVLFAMLREDFEDKVGLRLSADDGPRRGERSL